MRRVQIHMEEGMDDEAAREAAREGISKAALIRRCVAEGLGARRNGADDPWAALVGWLDDEPVGNIDEVLYGKKS